MQLTTIPSFAFIGLSIRTTNENQQAMQDIPALWARFFTENTLAKIPDKVDDMLYCIYTDYEKDHTKPYTTLLGCKVESLDNIPDGLTGRLINGGIYTTFTAQGNINEGIVIQEWIKIWNSDINRAYTADIEVYGAKAQNPEKAEIAILIAIQ
ncbi:GyrI-like domain-containing protein [Emticicia agri]|uniref:AraC family transcriptional regulator n=1 Tax=Emticicia agri TaxID=2492393 RepID=A0A4Q5M576_9BACT|nr:GyrI-like domain-containing protein [Emticicia agri]RYU97568.1 AraC family transcriptional regulator [Emticicia agri]